MRTGKPSTTQNPESPLETLGSPLDFSRFPTTIVIDNDLSLSSFELSDTPELERIAVSEDVQKYIPWAKEDKATYIERITRDRNSRGPRYAIRYQNNLVGHFAIFPSPDILGVIEMGYVLSSDYRGIGIISRVLPVCESLVGELLPDMKVGLFIDDENIASQSVAHRAGYSGTDTASHGERLYLKASADE